MHPFLRDMLRPIGVMLILCICVVFTRIPLNIVFVQPLTPWPMSYTVKKESLTQHIQEAYVTHVADGDTFTIDTTEKVRILGLNTPEIAHPEQNIREQCYGRSSKLLLEKLIGQKTVYLIADTQQFDKYKRLLRHVYLPHPTRPDLLLWINGYLVGEGYAQTLFIKPNTLYNDKLQQLEINARELSKGIWTACDTQNFSQTKFTFQK